MHTTLLARCPLNRFTATALTALAMALATLPLQAQVLTPPPTPAVAPTSTVVAAQAVTAGQPLPALALKDQHDQAWQVPANTRLVLLATGRKASNLVQAVLEKEAPDFLLQHRTVYAADLSKMPSFATRMFALPSLRGMPFKVGVSLDEATLAQWPRATDAVTLIELNNGLVQRTGFAKTEAELRAALAP